MQKQALLPYLGVYCMESFASCLKMTGLERSVVIKLLKKMYSAWRNSENSSGSALATLRVSLLNKCAEAVVQYVADEQWPPMVYLAGKTVARREDNERNYLDDFITRFEENDTNEEGSAEKCEQSESPLW